MLVHCQENCSLNDSEKRIIDDSVKSYKLRGIDLPEEKQKRLKEISKKLSELSQKFENNTVDDQK